MNTRDTRTILSEYQILEEKKTARESKRYLESEISKTPIIKKFNTVLV